GGGDTDPGQCDAGPDVTLLVDDVPVTGLSAGQGQYLDFAVDVPAGLSRVRFDTWKGSGDADLYVAHERQPTTEDYDYAPFLVGNTERVIVRRPATGRWYIRVNAYEAFNGLKVRVRFYD
ncbi:MAG: PPC domain-containing protein, partial [Pseudomonadota bacterium]